MNACESDIIADFVNELNISEYILINTCAVTAESERKLRQTIRKLYNENNNVKIILTGCASELHPEIYIKLSGVVGIISNKMKLSKMEYEEYSTSKQANKKVTNKKVRGFLQIQNGCDQKCTYCIVRITRGNSVSFSEEDIVTQAQKLIIKGYKEIVLTGVNISSYGRDLENKNLAHIIRHLLKNVPQIKRLRLSSLDPVDIDNDLINVFAGEEKLLPHIHESIQSGDNLILKRMMRRHTRDHIIELNQRIIEKRPDIIFGADIIAGFPTESDEMFLNTKQLIHEAGISLLHFFPFSSRPLTTAALMPQIKKNIIKQRIIELQSLAHDVLFKKLSEFMDKTVKILAENHFTAKTDSFLNVVSNDSLIAGREYLFYCESVHENAIIGKPIKILD